MDRGHAFRRAFHLASPLFLGYYIVPEDLGGGLSRAALLVLFVGTAGCIEIARIGLGVHLFGMRPYEGNRVSAYAQGTLGLLFGLLIVRDPRIVVPVFIGMAWIDPFAALARNRSWPRWLPVAAYAALFLAVSELLALVIADPFPLGVRTLFAGLAALAAVGVEGPRIPQVDDDLLMQVVPMALLAALAGALTAAGLG